MSNTESPTPDADRSHSPVGTIPGPGALTHPGHETPTVIPLVSAPVTGAAALTVGSMLAGYKLMKKLGEGGMGIVFIAEDISLRRQVALKVMRPQVAACEASKQRFFREARAAARLEHDNVVGIHQIGEENGVPFLAMPLLKGESLGDRLKREPVLPVPMVLSIGRDIADGLSIAHEHGLVHRDIKPDNIWIEPIPATNGERAKILDFGLVGPHSTDESLVTQAGAILGTPAYMAPEQACGMTVDHRADLFSLGCVLYKMSTGRRPFNGRNTIEILSSLATETPLEPLVLVADMRPILSAIIMRLLEKDPAARPQTAREVADAFRQLQPESLVVVSLQASSLPWAQPDAQSEIHSLPTPDITSPDSRRSKSSTPSVAPVPSTSWRSRSQKQPAAGENAASSGGLRRLGIFLLLAGGLSGGFYLLNRKPADVPAEVGPSRTVVKVTEGMPTPPSPISTKEAPPVLPPSPEISPEPRLVIAKKPDPIPAPREMEPTTEIVDIPPRLVKKEPPIDVVVVPPPKKELPLVEPPPKKELPPDILISRPKVAGHALQFREGSSVQIPGLKLDRSGPFTLEAYVTPGDKSFAGMNSIMWIPGQISLAIPYAFWSFSVYPEGSGIVTVKAAVKENKRTHIAAVRTDRQLLLFVDGKLVGSREGPKDRLLPSREPLMIGASMLPKASSFHGLIGEIRISKTARYEKDFTPPARFENDRDTAGLYHLDEGRGDTLKDSSGNEHEGSIVGAKWVKSDGSPIVPFSKNSGATDSDRPMKMKN